jgi:division protein CdvB (Snf7/Vps24/ESCRT-III family)
VETAVTMRQVTGNMTSVVRGMDRAMESMNLDRVRLPHYFVASFTLTLRQDFSRHGQI